MGKFDGMDPQLVRELLAETKRAAVDLRETEGRVSRIMSRAGLATQTTHRPVQVAEAADKMVKDVSARLDLLEKRAADEGPSSGGDRRTGPPSADDKPAARDEKPGDQGQKRDADQPERRDDPPSARDEKPGDQGEKPDARDEKPDAGQPDRRDETPGTRDEKPGDQGQKPDARDVKPDAGQPDRRDDPPGTREETPGVRDEKPDAGQPDGDGSCGEDAGVREDRPDARDEKPDAGQPDRRDDPPGTREETPGVRDEKPDAGQPDGDGGCGEDAGVREDRPDARDEKPDAGQPERRDETPGVRDGSTQDITDTPGKDHPDDIDTSRPQIVEIDGVKVLQVPIDPPTASELESLLETLDGAQPADMPSAGDSCDGGVSQDRPEGDRAKPDGRQATPGTGQDAASRDGDTGLVVPPTPPPDDAATVTVAAPYAAYGSGEPDVVALEVTPPTADELRELIRDARPMEMPSVEAGPDGPPGQVEPAPPRRGDDEGRSV